MAKEALQIFWLEQVAIAKGCGNMEKVLRTFGMRSR